MPATITGTVFNDLNHNGQLDTGEPGIPNVFVVLFSAGGTCTAVQTNDSGAYSFSITAAGTYTVYEPVANPGATCPPTIFTQPPGFTMSNGPRKLSVTVTAAQITGNVTIGNVNFSHDTVNNPLSCSTNLIQFLGRPSVWFNINTVTGEAIPQGTVNPPVDINAIGYNPTDNYIYGYDQLNNHIVRVDNSGNVITLSPLPTGFPADAYTTGTFDLSGFLYLFVNNNTRFYVVDLRPDSATFMKLVNPANGFQEQTSNFGVALSRALNVSDWVFDPNDGNLYGITPQGIVERIVPTTGVITDIATTPHNTGPFGAIALDSTGTIYAISNNDGNIYRYIIVGNTATASKFSASFSTSFNDATICPFTLIAVDFGDAPDTSPGNGPDDYSTLLANNGPRHQLVNTLFLGTTVTAEVDALQNATATGDDIPQGIQDDGVVVPLPPLPIAAVSYEINVTVTNQTGQSANLYGWVDFNTDGIFQGNEASPVQVVPSQPGTQSFTLQFTVPSGITPSATHTFVRLRLTTDSLINQNDSAAAEDTRSVGPAADGEVEDYIVQIAEQGQLKLVKEVTPTEAAPGDVVTYTFTVSNPNVFPLTNVRIEDSLLGLIDIISSLDSGSAITLHVEFTVPSGAPAGSVITNVVTAISDQTPIVEASAQVTVLPLFSLSITKTPDRLSVPPGEIVTYTITVTNTSNAPITNVNVTDSLVGFSEVIPSLAAGEFRTFQVPFTVPLGTVAGTFFTNLTTATSAETGPASDTATIVVPSIPEVFIEKSVTPQTAVPGETATYTITVTNAGNDTLTNVRIVDPTLGIDDIFDAVKPGESVIITVPFMIPLTSMPGDTLVNVATVTTDQTSPRTADAIVTVVGQPGIALVKTVTPQQAIAGGAVTYEFVVTNTDTTVLTNVQLTDPLLGLNQTIGSLGVGESRTIHFPFVVPTSAFNPFINTATVNGTFGTDTVRASADASLTVIFPQPAFTVTKTADQVRANPGDTVLFTITIVNTGNIPLTNVVISDPQLSYSNTINTLEPGGSVTETIPFIVPANAVPGSAITNIVTVSPAETGPQQDTASVIVNTNPSMALTKTPDLDNALPGDTVTYTVTVANTGNVDLTNVSVSDAMLGLNAVIPLLAVGQSQSFTLPFTIPPGTPAGTVITNTSTAFSDQTDAMQASANVLVNALPPLLTVVKTPNRFTAAPGDTISYTITVTNPGTVVLTNVVLTDGTLGIVQPIGTLNPGQSATFTFFFTIPLSAANNSVIVNTAVATSDQTNPAESSSSVTVDPSPGLQIVKTFDPVQAAPGQVVTATIVVRNTGNVTLTNVVVNDATLNFETTVPSLPAGSTIVIPVPFQTPFAAAGTVVTNTATAFSDETGPISSSAALTVLPQFQLSLAKSVTPTVALPGQSVTFNIEIRNTSNATLTNLHLTDDLLSFDEFIDVFPAGVSISLSRTFTIPEEARAGTVFTNTALLTSAEAAPVSSVAQVTVGPDPKLTLSKTVFPPEAFPGQVVFFRLESQNTGDIPLTNIRYADPLLGINVFVATQDVGTVLAVLIPFTVPADATPGQSIVNTLFSDSTQTGRQSVSATVRVVALPLTVTKEADTPIVFVGDTVRFTIRVENTSNIAVANVVLDDVLPNGTQLVPDSATIEGRPVRNANPAAGIPLGDLGVGQSVQVSFKAKQTVLPHNAKLRNQASVSFQPSNSFQRFTVFSNMVVVEVEEHVE